MHYPIQMTPDDNGTFLVTCPDLPEVTTFGRDHTECLSHGTQAVNEAIASRLAAFEDIPMPTPGRGDRAHVDPLLAIKTELLWATREAGLTRADLVRRLNVHRPQVDRLFDPRHASKLDQLQSAFTVLGKRLDVRIETAA